MHSEDDVKRAWEESAEAWVDFVRTGKDYTRDGLNNPATFHLIGDVTGLVVLDLACGEGYNARILARMGAKAIGIDLSESMIEYARTIEVEEKLGVEYCVLDAADLKGVADNHFDLVTCFMALQDIEGYTKAVGEASRVLKPIGRFVFSIPHPCFEKIVVNGKKVDAGARYFEETKFPIVWDMERLSKPFKTISFHRPLTSYFDALHKSDLYVSRLIEPRLTEQACQKYSYLREALIRPQSVIIESMKIART